MQCRLMIFFLIYEKGSKSFSNKTMTTEKQRFLMQNRFHIALKFHFNIQTTLVKQHLALRLRDSMRTNLEHTLVIVGAFE